MVSPLATGSTAATLSASGSNTGVVPPDVLAQVTKTLQSKNTLAPKLNAALANDQTKLSGLGQLRGALATFQNVVQAVSGDGLSTAAQSSSTAVLKATGSKSAQAGTYNVVVAELAQSQVLQSKTTASADTLIGSGTPSTIKIDFGSANSSGFVPSGASKTIKIDSGNNSLAGIASAINAADTGVTAKVVRSGNQSALQLTSPTGTSQTLRISVSGDADVKNLLEYNPAGQKGLSQITAAKNAEFTVNGVAGSSASNTVTTAIAGTRLELAGKGTSSVVVTQDNSQIATNVSNLVSSFNQLSSKLKTLAQGELKSDGSAARVQDALNRTLRNSSVTGSDGNTLTLASVGISSGANGDLVLDKTKLQAAVAADPSGVSRLFAQSGTGVADSLNGQIKNAIGSDGSITRESAAINKDISSLNAKKANLAKALTLQANALIKQYSAQQNTALPGLPDGAPRSLFDIIG